MGASSRLRAMQFIPWLESSGMDCELQAFFSDEMLAARYQAGQYGRAALIQCYWTRIRRLVRDRAFDLLWIEKEVLPWFPAWLERALLPDVPYALDYDDALFHHYDMNRSRLVRSLLGHRIDRLMKGARLVTAGNEYLAQRARDAGAPWVEVLPTVIDLDRYTKEADVKKDNVPRIVWIGSPSTVRYLNLLKAPLSSLASHIAFKVRVIGANVSIPGIDVEIVPWNESTEVEALAQCDIGVMPLVDSPWERGKCGYKLIQYMACGLPVVASAVGANMQIIRDGENGFLVGAEPAWEARLRQLLADAALRNSMGRAGRRRVEETYCVQQVAPRMAHLLKQAGAR
jgi:glycosyltransferase involved in cell wall biosynthesis